MIYTEEQLMARLKFFIGICLSLTLFGDQKFFELIVPIATFLTGTLSGIMLAGGDKDAQAAALKAANSGWDRPPTPTPSAPKSPAPSGFSAMPAGAPLFTPTAPVNTMPPAMVALSSNGKPMPIQPEQPEL